MNDIQFENRQAFWLLCLIPIMILWYLLRLKKQEAEFHFSSFQNLGTIKTSYKVWLRHFPFVFRILCVLFLIVVLARPQARNSWKDVKTEGIDLMLSIDVSYSMLAKDFNPNRIEAAKEVAKEFIDSRPNDRIGFVIFGGEMFTQCPLTTDHSVIKNLLSQINAGDVGQGTAIGLGLAGAVSRIKESSSKSKVVILLSDGVNNTGEIAPLTAADIAKTFGVRVYTVGVGTKGKALTPISMLPNGQMEYDYVDVDIDENTMTKIAEETGGKYFRATDNESLRTVYKEIDRLEKSIISEKNYSNKEERFLPFALAALVFLLLEFITKKIIIRQVP
ncbi:MAG: VWA domain-containing protein [Bacteroidetes bacterium]|nr:VWA domain-containing protein [Bacteroidota bacterium]